MTTAYVTRSEFYDFAIPSGSLINTSTGTIDLHISAASDLIDGFARSQHTVPFLNPPTLVKLWTSQIGAFTLLTSEGYTDAAQFEVFQNWYVSLVGSGDAPGLLTKVANGEIPLADDIDSTPGENEGAPQLRSGNITTDDNPDIMGWRTHSSS